MSKRMSFWMTWRLFPRSSSIGWTDSGTARVVVCVFRNHLTATEPCYALHFLNVLHNDIYCRCKWHCWEKFYRIWRCQIPQTLNVSGHICIIFFAYFLTRNYTMASMCANFFSPVYILLYIYACFSNCLFKDASFRHKPVKIANGEAGRWAFISESYCKREWHFWEVDKRHCLNVINYDEIHSVMCSALCRIISAKIFSIRIPKVSF